MAKQETKVEQISKKTKAKKRKHTVEETEDEIANKSIILDTQPQVEEPQESTKKAKKRKHKHQDKIKTKRNKKTDNSSEEDDNLDSAKDINTEHSGSEVEDDDTELHQPTMEELCESEKPENNTAVLTNRQKKRLKHQERLNLQKGNFVEKEVKRNEEYLHKWKHARSEWKFEKLRQISIQNSLFDIDKINADTWPIALEYLSGSKGAAKDKIVKLAEETIDQLDTQCSQMDDESERHATINSVKYQRARELLQSFD